MNGIRDELRRAHHPPRIAPLEPTHAHPGPSPLELAIGQKPWTATSALATLTPTGREAVVARIDLGCTYAEIAQMLGKSSTNAAHMAVERAIVRLVEGMRRQRGDQS